MIFFISGILIGYPTEVLCTVCFSTVKLRQISNIHTHGFLLKYKIHLNLLTDQSNSPKKTIKTLSCYYCSIKLYDRLLQSRMVILSTFDLTLQFGTLYLQVVAKRPSQAILMYYNDSYCSRKLTQYTYKKHFRLYCSIKLDRLMQSKTRTNIVAIPRMVFFYVRFHLTVWYAVFTGWWFAIFLYYNDSFCSGKLPQFTY